MKKGQLSGFRRAFWRLESPSAEFIVRGVPWPLMGCRQVVKKLLLISALIALHQGATRAQDAPAPPAVSAITGTVIDGLTRQPLAAANVSARNFMPGQSGVRVFSATTDSEGQFTISSVSPGRYVVSASLPGYVGGRLAGFGSSGRALTVAPDQHVDGLTLLLTPGASVVGHIKDKDGKPIAGVAVQVMRYFYDEGQKQLHGVGSPSSTNAGGEYRITGLAAGQYYLLATATFGSAEAKKPANQAYASTYYPGNRDVARATPLAIRPGEELAGIDMTLTPVRTVSISGRVLMASTSAPAPGAEVMLAEQEGGDASAQRQCLSDAKGNFELQGVPPGAYEIIAQVEPKNRKSKALFGRKSIKVGEANLRKLDVRIGPGIDLTGHIRVDDKAHVDFSRMTATLQARESSTVSALLPGVDNATVKPDGTFTFADVPDGTYSINVYPLPPGNYLKATGRADVLDTGITIARGQPQGELDLTLSPSAARLEGTVSNDQQPAAGAAVVLIPEGIRKTQPRYYRQLTTDQSGRFSMRGIIPGDYRVLAFEDLERGAYLNPDFLQRFEDSGESVQLQEGANLNVRLDVIPASETSP
jgi:large repetitive protein